MNDDVREAADRATKKIAELQGKMWNSLAEGAGGSPNAVADQEALRREYDAAIADLVAFRNAFPNG